MRTHLASLFALACSAAMLPVGCLADVDPPAADEDTLSTESVPGAPIAEHFFFARKDMRKCRLPICGGYFVKEVNVPGKEVYVNGLDLSRMDEATAADIHGAPSDELILRGYYGARDIHFGTRPLVVAGAFRGLPGVNVAAGEFYYLGGVRYPPVMCMAAPCNNDLGYVLNMERKIEFTRYSAARPAAATHVEEAWIIDRILHHGALFTGKISPGKLLPAGREKIFDVGQVFITLPATRACAAQPDPLCGTNLTPTWMRDPEGCKVHDDCAFFGPGVCSKIPRLPTCGDGYRIEAWLINPPECVGFACVPAFYRVAPTKPEPPKPE